MRVPPFLLSKTRKDGMRRLLIEDLLQKPEQVNIKVGDKEIGLWVRPATTTEKAMASALGRKASRNIRKLLNNKKSDEYQSLVLAEVESGDRESLERIWINGKLVPKILEIRQRSLEEREYIPEPEGELVTGREMDEYEDAVDSSEESREDQFTKAVASATRELEEQVKKLSDKELHKVAIPPLIDSRANQAFELEFTARLIYRCTFEDEECKLPAFTDIEQVYKLKPSALAKLTAAHLELLGDAEEVKN